MADTWLDNSDSATGVLGSPMQNLIRAMGFVAVVFVLATLGFVHAGWSFADAIYMVTLTIFSVGFGEVHPIDTPYLRVLAMGTIVLGCTGMIVFTGALVQVFAHFQIRRMLGVDRMNNEIEKLSGHAIICGFGRIGVQLAKELAQARQSFVVLDWYSPATRPTRPRCARSGSSARGCWRRCCPTTRRTCSSPCRRAISTRGSRSSPAARCRPPRAS
jgi:voltage-gated potassium channel